MTRKGKVEIVLKAMRLSFSFTHRVPAKWRQLELTTKLTRAAGTFPFPKGVHI